jgi:hypothetical protein
MANMASMANEILLATFAMFATCFHETAGLTNNVFGLKGQDMTAQPSGLGGGNHPTPILSP